MKTCRLTYNHLGAFANQTTDSLVSLVVTSFSYCKLDGGCINILREIITFLPSATLVFCSSSTIEHGTKCV